MRIVGVVLGALVGCGPPPRPTVELPEPPEGALARSFHLPGLTLRGGGFSTIDLAIGPDGLHVAGDFVQADQVRSSPVRWTSTEWIALPPLYAAHVAIDRAGVVYAASDYVGPCDLCSPSTVWRLDGDRWTDITGLLIGDIDELVATRDGLVAVGWFDIGFTQRAHVARLEPAGWRVLGRASAGEVWPVVHAVVERAGETCVGGFFTAIDGVPARSVACLANGVWSQAGDGLDGDVVSLAVASDGRLVAGGSFVTTGGNHVAILDATWSALGGGLPDSSFVQAVATMGSAIIVGGKFASPAANVARFEGGAWTSLGDAHGPDNFSGQVTDLAVDGETLYLAGRFDTFGGAAVADIARWTAAGASALVATGSTPLGIYGEVRVLVEDSTGAVIAGGFFDAAGTTLASNVARLVGDRWESMGDPGERINALVRLQDGTLVAGGSNGAVLGWDGTVWTPIAPRLDASVSALLELEDELIVAGSFEAPSWGVARWNGVAYEAMDGLPPYTNVLTLGIDARGQVCAGIGLDARGGPPLWCWDGATWSPEVGVFGRRVTSIATLLDGSTLVAGSLGSAGSPGEPPTAALARYRTYWEMLESQPADGHSVAPYEGGVLVLGEAGLVWWDGYERREPMMIGQGGYALLPASGGVFAAGTFAPDEAGPISSGLGFWLAD